MRRCCRCRLEKPETDFWRDASTATGFRHRCKPCELQSKRETYARHGRPDRRKQEVGRIESAPVDSPPPIGPTFQPVAQDEGRTTVVAFGDTHFPFHHREALWRAVDIAEKTKPDVVVQLGDLYDSFSFSKYPRSHNVITPDNEFEEGRHHALAFWKAVRQACPDAQCFQLRGNHDDRPLKRVVESMPAGESFVVQGLRELYAFDGVTTLDDSAEELEVDGVLYQHGRFSQIGQHLAWNQQSTVCGHLHRGGLVFRARADAIHFELNAGWLGDRKAPVFSYHAQKRMHGTTLGLGVVDPLGARFIPL